MCKVRCEEGRALLVDQWSYLTSDTLKDDVNRFEIEEKALLLGGVEC